MANANDRKTNIIGIVPETADPTAPPRQAIMQEILSPGDMALINTGHRLMWRINSIVAKVMHELFLTIGQEDVVVITGKQSDYTAFFAVSQAFAAAGWFSLVTRSDKPEGNLVLLVAQAPQVVLNCFEKELKLDRKQWEDNGWLPNPQAPGAGAENIGTEGTGEAKVSKHTPPSKGTPERN